MAGRWTAPRMTSSPATRARAEAGIGVILKGGVWGEGRGGFGAIKNPPGGPGGVFGFCVSRLGGAHHPVPARKGMVVVPVVVIMDAKRPVAEAAIAVVFMLARR